MMPPILALLMLGSWWIYAARGDSIGIIGIITGVVVILALPYLIGVELAPGRRSSEGIGCRSNVASVPRSTFLAYSTLTSQFRYLLYASSGIAAYWGSVVIREGFFGELSRGAARFLYLLMELGPYLAAATVPFLLSFPIRRGRPLGVALNRDGIYHSAWFGACFYPWDSIDSLKPIMRQAKAFLVLVGAGQSRPGHVGESLLAHLPPFRTSMARIRVGHMAQHPALVLHAIRYYHEHPEARAELGTERSVERIRSADFGGFVTDATPDHSLTDPPDRPGRGWGQT